MHGKGKSLAATADVPAAIYSIPPSSPAYAVTDVKPTKASDEDEVEFSSTEAYAAGVIVAMGASGDNALAEQLRGAGFTVETVGDCNGVGYIEGAIRGAAETVARLLAA